MKKIIIGLVGLVILLLPIVLSEELPVEWTQIYDSGIEDLAQSIAIDSNGNIFVICASGVSGLELKELRIIKYDLSGNKYWERKINGYALHIAPSLKTDFDSQGNLIIIAYNLTTRDTWLLKYNPAINKIIPIAKLPDFPEYDFCNYFGVAVQNDDLIVIGNTGEASLERMYDYFIIKFNGSTGKEKWRQTYNFKINNNSFYDTAYAIAIKSNSIFIAGTSVRQFPLESYAVIIKLNVNGGIEWVKALPIENASTYDIALDNNGNIFIPIMSPDGSCIVKLNSKGNIIWQTDFQTILFPPDYKAIEIKDGDIYVGGEIIKAGNYFYIEKFNENGNSLGNNTYGISDWNQFCDMALKDGVIVMGTSLGNISLVKFSIEGLKLGKEEERNKGIPGFEIIFVIGAIILAIRKFNH